MKEPFYVTAVGVLGIVLFGALTTRMAAHAIFEIYDVGVALTYLQGLTLFGSFAATYALLRAFAQ